MHRSIIAMAPVYTARNTSPKEVSPPLFTIKGVKNKIPALLSSLGIFAHVLAVETAYAGYRACIEAFIFASSMGQGVVANAIAFPTFKPRGRLPLALPELAFTLQQALPMDKANKLAGMMEGGKVNKVGNMQVFTADKLPIELFNNSIMRGHAESFNPPGEQVNPHGRSLAVFLLGGIFEFLATHTYPAFRSNQTMSRDQYPAQIHTVLGKNHGVPSSYLTKSDTTPVTTMATYSVSHSLPFVGTVEDTNMTEAGTSSEKLTFQDNVKFENVAGFMTIRGNDPVIYAKPSPGRAANNFGSTTKIPESPGLVFPYFHGLIRPSAHDLLAYTTATFYRLFGTTGNECKERYQQFRHGAHSLSKTKLGMELTHILYMIRLALDTQTRLFLVIEDEVYKGAVLLGTGFNLHDGAKWVSPEESVAKDLLLLDPTARALSELTRKFTEMKLNGNYSGPDLTKDFLATPNKFIEVFKNLKIDNLDNAAVRELDSLFMGLNLRGDGFLPMNPQGVQQFVEEYFGSPDFLLKLPTFIPSVRAPIETKEFALLSRFGPEAPSFWNEKGQELPVVAGSSSSSKGKRKLDESDLYANMPKEFHITPKPLLVAVNDMKKVISKRAVKMDLKERARGYRTIGLVSESSIKSIWGVMVEGLDRDEVVVPETKKAKVDAGKPSFDEIFKFL